MKDQDAKNRIQKLREEISRLRFLYHVEDSPDVTDDVYDSLNNELKSLLEKYPEYVDINAPENRVGGKPLDKFTKVKHEIRMLSMNDVFSFPEVLEWENRISKITNKKHSYFCELKLDGLSASLIYKDGLFVEGSTRGDGWIGEDVTENLKMIDTIPLQLEAPYPPYLEIRGEVVMQKKVWLSLNKIQEKEGKQPFANTRNAAAGSLRQLDPKIARQRKLDFFAWDLTQFKNINEELRIKNHSEKHDLLRKLGFKVPPYEKKAETPEQVFAFIEEVEKIRQNLPYGTDGIVVSIDELELQENLGVVGKAPRYMVAYKYQAERATTILKDITVNVGRTGVLTPVAHFNPTLVAGSTVSKATLHNIDQINRLDIRIGDTVVIQKAGDVIPEVVEVLSNMRTGKEKKFKMPENCPVCESKVEQRQAGVIGNYISKAGIKQSSSSQMNLTPRLRKSSMSNGLAPLLPRPRTLQREAFSESGGISVAFYCTNKNCPARSRRGLQHFVNIFEIYEIGPRILDRLKDEGLVSDGADLFTLEKADLSGLERFGEKSADNIISSIQLHKKISLWRFIYSLGIIHVGEQTARDLADHFGKLEKIISSSVDEINSIANIGPVVSQSVYEYFHDKTNIHFIEKLIDNGVSIYHEKVKSLKLSGKTFVLTGTLSTMSRNDAKKKIIDMGGSVASSVSSNTSYVIKGDKPGSKYDEALALGVKVLTENEFLKII
ncbi:MAG: NAD-dependent DNA ligase LigA [Candidatus Nomurabacteria bacterium]|nr:NAD-dependent DNA ligase LigA [Candidatus Nomurabacteria bacterium]